jgi:hypothetical protein
MAEDVGSREPREHAGPNGSDVDASESFLGEDLECPPEEEEIDRPRVWGAVLTHAIPLHPGETARAAALTSSGFMTWLIANSVVVP